MRAWMGYLLSSKFLLMLYIYSFGLFETGVEKAGTGIPTFSDISMLYNNAQR
jgi:hypothetical protein